MVRRVRHGLQRRQRQAGVPGPRVRGRQGDLLLGVRQPRLAPRVQTDASVQDQRQHRVHGRRGQCAKLRKAGRVQVKRLRIGRLLQRHSCVE